MRRKTLTAFVSLLGCIALLASCDNEEMLPIEKSKVDDIWWGFFKGSINGEEVSLKNGEYPNRPISTVKRSIYPMSHLGPDSINVMNTSIRYDEYATLALWLYDLTPGERHLTLSVWEDTYDSFIKLVSFLKGPNNEIVIRATYVPKVNNPFRVKIADVTWVSPFEPIIEAKLDGVLYNEKNPEDSIVINGVYGAR